MAADGVTGGRVAGQKGGSSGFHWVSSSPTPVEVERLESSFPEVVCVPVDELEAEMVGWQGNAILARSFSKWVPALAFVREFRRAGIQGEIVPISLAHRCHIFRFDDPKAGDLALSRPWVINGQIIGMERWRPEFIPAEESIPFALIWVRLPNLPLEFWREDFLRAITGAAGQFVCVDASTLARSRGGYARVCLRVDLRLPLRPGIRVQGINLPFWQQFAFESLEGLCSSCGSMHLEGACAMSTGRSDEASASGPVFGSWLAVVRQRRDVGWSKKAGSKISSSSVIPGVSASVSASLVSQDGRRLEAGEVEGWRTPVKVARRRLPASRNVVFMADGCSGDPVAEGRKERGVALVSSADSLAVPVVERAGSEAEKRRGGKSSGVIGSPPSVAIGNPFAGSASGLMGGSSQDCRDACPGPLKRARPIDGPARRSVSKGDNRKGKGKFPQSKSVGSCSFPPVLLPLALGIQEGVAEGRLINLECVREMSEEIVVQENVECCSVLKTTDMSIGYVDPVDVSEGLKVGSSMVIENDTLESGCLSDSAMMEGQGLGPISSNE